MQPNKPDQAKRTVEAWIGLGGNVGDVARTLTQAFDALAALPNTTLKHTSSLYGSKPFGPVAQDDFVNAVAVVDTQLPPHDLLACLMALERMTGRVRSERWGPRTLDLDVLLYGDVVLDDDILTLPHPGIAQRAFVLLPMLEVNPEQAIDGAKTVAMCFDALSEEAKASAWKISK